MSGTNKPLVLPEAGLKGLNAEPETPLGVYIFVTLPPPLPLPPVLSLPTPPLPLTPELNILFAIFTSLKYLMPPIVKLLIT